MYPAKPLGEILEKITDGTHQTPTYFEKGVIFLSSKNVTTGKIDWENVKYIDENQHIEISKRITPKKGDILLAKNGTTGVGAIVDKDEIFDIYVSLALLRPTEKIFSKFLWYFINSSLARKQFNSRLKGSGVPNLHLKEIKEVKIPLPPLQTQQKIVEKLDKIFEKIDKNIEITKKNISNVEEENNSLLEGVFSECEKEFGVVKLGTICEIIGGGTPKTDIPEYWSDEIIWLSPTDLPEIGKIVQIEDSSKKISKLGLEKSSAKLLPVGTVIFSSRATIGKIAINKKELSTNQGFTNFICSEQILNKFLAYALKNFTEKIVRLSNSTTFKEVNKTNLRNFQIPLPPLPIQQKIVEKLDKIFAKNSELKNFYEKNLKNLEELKQSILKQAFEDENFIK